MRLSPKDYARMIGHSEQFVRNYCMPARLRTDPEAKIELKIPTDDILANCHKMTSIGSEERRKTYGSNDRRM
jgi:hypothetical protein